MRDGHIIADKIKTAKTISEIDDIDEEIKEFSDFVDKNFGTPVDFEEKSSSDLTSMLYMAAEEKARQLEYYPSENSAGNEDVLDFEEMLDSKNWFICKYDNRC